ncbi:hypothetical protein L3X38_018460 [Prunus dulcis]|uniref:tryptophan synthase n=1 Tax=Prunus dulcis TaxID=3755 RepID=A0AAD4ZBN0_PRUDU|nr:hypothetical protein L3X38_018460 [Prunus dulcis]
MPDDDTLCLETTGCPEDSDWSPNADPGVERLETTGRPNGCDQSPGSTDVIPCVSCDEFNTIPPLPCHCPSPIVILSQMIPRLLREIREATTKPVAVGFGLSKPEHVKQVAEWGADGVIVGSAIVNVLGEPKSPKEGLKALETFPKSFTSALLG